VLGLIGQNTQQYPPKADRKSERKLSTTPLTVSEITYELGFEDPQSFRKLFKQKTNKSPFEFRTMFIGQCLIDKLALLVNIFLEITFAKWQTIPFFLRLTFVL
ncbi:MAG: AraC family transcriptional regulator, partial [Flavobacterium sp.]